MGTPKRERHKARHRANREAELAYWQRRRRMRIALWIGAAALVVVIAVIGIVLITGDDGVSSDLIAATGETTDDFFATSSVPDDEAAATTAAPTDETAPATTTTSNGTETSVAPQTPECPPEDASGPRITQFTEAPPMCIGDTDRFRATLATNRGDIVWELDAGLDPVSVNNFVFLARHHYYDGSTFHRIINNFVIQGGDPIGNPRGTGGPGYDFTGGTPTEPYEIGDIAMANRGDPSSNGAQFFIITGPNGASLPPLYSPLGKVVEGMELADELQKVPTGAGDAPLEDIVVESISIEPV